MTLEASPLEDREDLALEVDLYAGGGRRPGDKKEGDLASEHPEDPIYSETTSLPKPFQAAQVSPRLAAVQIDFPSRATEEGAQDIGRGCYQGP